MTDMLHVVTYNIHKGFSQFNRRLIVHDLRDHLRDINADIVFLQEVQGQHTRHARLHTAWPQEPQHEFLAADVWRSTAYGRNVVYDHGHHGNAILSRYPIIASLNQNVTRLRFEPRGLLHCVIETPQLARPLHCVCAHLSLFKHSRKHQLDILASRIEAIVPPDAPLVIAGDFNDWRNHAHALLAERLGLIEAFSNQRGLPSRSFPSALPLLRLDRIYTRGFSVLNADIHAGRPWSKNSDHASLSTRLLPHIT
jgi:endonuclease/exonuclease/phosphatase family metal-dependent hydrolase